MNFNKGDEVRSKVGKTKGLKGFVQDVHGNLVSVKFLLLGERPIRATFRSENLNLIARANPCVDIEVRNMLPARNVVVQSGYRAGKSKLNEMYSDHFMDAMRAFVIPKEQSIAERNMDNNKQNRGELYSFSTHSVDFADIWAELTRENPLAVVTILSKEHETSRAVILGDYLIRKLKALKRFKTFKEMVTKLEDNVYQVNFEDATPEVVNFLKVAYKAPWPKSMPLTEFNVLMVNMDA